MLCELMSTTPSSFILTWATIAVLGTLSVVIFSGPVFLLYYAWPTYEKWQYKVNPKFPSVWDVRNELIQTGKGILAAAFPPALSLYLAQQNLSKAYCGVGEYGWTYLILSVPFIWLFVDLYEFAYHMLGHTSSAMWQVHKHHHRFFNPSPFAVIADEPLDQVVRAMPMLLFPMVVPVNMDMLFGLFTLCFYGWGVYLHWGFELSWPDAHHPWINTSYQHFAHHSLSMMNKPYHTGFHIRIWDDLAGTVYPREKCFCSKCAREKGERSFDAWQKIEKPDYTPLLSLSFWLSGNKGTKYSKKA